MRAQPERDEERLRAKKAQAAEELVYLSRLFHQRGWVLGTSGNFSIKLEDEPLLFAITASGLDKGRLTVSDIILVNEHGEAAEPTSLKPSAESLVHAAIYRKTGCGSVLHVHAIYAALLSDLCRQQGEAVFSGLEMLKGLDLWQEDAVCRLPVIENCYDIERLAQRAAERLRPETPGLLIARHGLYAWGRNSSEAQRHLEILEYLCHYQYLQRRH